MRSSSILLLTMAALTGFAPPAHTSALPEEFPTAVLERIGFDQNLGATLPLDTSFVHDDGRTVELGDLIGERPVVLCFVYYECPMLCTLVLNGLVSSLRAVKLDPGVDYDVVAISIDPGETPELAAAKKAKYLEELGRPEAAPSWHFLSGDEASIRAVADVCGFRYEYLEDKDEYAHASGLIVTTADGRLARYLYGVEFPPRDLRLGLVEASEGKVGSLVDQVLLLCLHYDPLTGKYGLAIMNTIRVLGGLTVGVMLVFIARSLLRDRRSRSTRATGAALPGAGG